jgi:hypothetical protein
MPNARWWWLQFRETPPPRASIRLLHEGLSFATRGEGHASPAQAPVERAVAMVAHE